MLLQASAVTLPQRLIVQPGAGVHYRVVFLSHRRSAEDVLTLDLDHSMLRDNTRPLQSQHGVASAPDRDAFLRSPSWSLSVSVC